MGLPHYRKISIWENNSRLDVLLEFNNLLVQYHEQLPAPTMFGEQSENAGSALTRQKLNFILDEVAAVIDAADIPTTMTVTPPPAIGGYIKQVHLIHSLFLLGQYRMSLQVPLDAVHRARGVYERDRRSAQFRTFNPLFWLWRAIEYVMSVPFELARLAGFNTAQIEGSLMGRLIKLAVGAISLLAALVQLGWVNW